MTPASGGRCGWNFDASPSLARARVSSAPSDAQIVAAQHVDVARSVGDDEQPGRRPERRADERLGGVGLDGDAALRRQVDDADAAVVVHRGGEGAVGRDRGEVLPRQRRDG